MTKLQFLLSAVALTFSNCATFGEAHLRASPAAEESELMKMPGRSYAGRVKKHPSRAERARETARRFLAEEEGAAAIPEELTDKKAGWEMPGFIKAYMDAYRAGGGTAMDDYGAWGSTLDDLPWDIDQLDIDLDKLGKEYDEENLPPKDWTPGGGN